MIKSRRMRWAGHVTCMGERKNACRILVGKPEGKRPLGRPTRRWEVNTVKPLFIVFVRGLKKKQWIWENNRCGSHS
jgi:hypothetical protein